MWKGFLCIQYLRTKRFLSYLRYCLYSPTVNHKFKKFYYFIAVGDFTVFLLISHFKHFLF